MKIKEVNQEIESIIGLNLDQFKKIVMIPQGEFREFLTAGTKDKSEILKKLFATEQYERIQLLIKEQFDAKKSIEKDLVTRLSEILREAQVEQRDIEMGKDALLETLEREDNVLQTLKEDKRKKDQEVRVMEQELLFGQRENEELEKNEANHEHIAGYAQNKNRPAVRQDLHPGKQFNLSRRHGSTTYANG